MCNFCKKSVKLFSMVVGVLFVVYFWNLDQKLLGWAYKQVNAMFDRKPVDIKFYSLKAVPAHAPHHAPVFLCVKTEAS